MNCPGPCIDGERLGNNECIACVFLFGTDFLYLIDSVASKHAYTLSALQDPTWAWRLCRRMKILAQLMIPTRPYFKNHLQFWFIQSCCSRLQGCRDLTALYSLSFAKLHLSQESNVTFSNSTISNTKSTIA